MSAKPPPVNLKDRIAALQQRNASSSSSSSSTSTSTPATNPGQLKAKIEKFEKKGGVPVPRGRFGLGVPPPQDTQPSRRGELYGNRIPQPVRSVSVNVTGGGVGTSTAKAGGERRVVSLSTGPEDERYFEEERPLRPSMTGGPPSSFDFVKTHTTGGTFQPSVQPVKMHSTGGATLTKRGTEFATALEKARKLEGERRERDVEVISTGGFEQEQAFLTVGDGEALPPPPSPFMAPAVPDIVVSPDASGIGAGLAVRGFVAGDLGDDDEVESQEGAISTAEEVLVQELEAQESTPTESTLPPTPIESPTEIITSSTPIEPPTEIITPPTPIKSPTEIITPPTPIKTAGRVSTDTIRPLPPSPSPPASSTSYPLPPILISTPTISLASDSEENEGEGEEEEEKPSRTSISEIHAEIDHALALMEAATPLSATFSMGSAVSSSGTPVEHEHEDETGHKEEEQGREEEQEQGQEEEQGQEQEVLVDTKKTPAIAVRPLPAPPSPPRPLPPKPSSPSAATASTTATTASTASTSTTSATASTTTATPSDALSPTSKHHHKLFLDLTVPSPISGTYPRSALASSDVEGDYGVGVGDLRAAAMSSKISSVSSSSSTEGTPESGEVEEKAEQGETLESQEEYKPITPTNASFLSPSGRPVSMYEMSPSKIEVATRLTPATSRGVPVFVPSSATTRKSDFVWFPPTPGRDVFEKERKEEEEKEDEEKDSHKDEEEKEEGKPARPKGPMRSATIHTTHKPSGSYSMPSRYLAHYVGEDGVEIAPPPPSKSAVKSTFTAIVHRKKRQLPGITPPSSSIPPSSNPTSTAAAAAALPERKPEPQRRLPETPAVQRVKVVNVKTEVPMTPGHGELTMLLQEAVLLEDRLNKGHLPAETPLAPSRMLKPEHPEVLQPRRRVSEDQVERRERERERREMELDVKAAAWARDQHIDAGDDVFVSPTSSQGAAAGKLRHTFLIPLSKAKTIHKKEGSNATIDAPPRPKSAFGERDKDLPNPHPQPTESLAPHPQSFEEMGYGQKKSPRSRFSSFKRLASGKYASSSSSGVPNGNVRHSNSTSSEMSVDEAVTPPDPSGEFGSDVGHAPSSLGHGSTHSGLSWPSLSPKRSHGSIGLGGRASSFAEKMWSRARTKSSTSTLSVYDSGDRIESIPESLAVSHLPPLPPIPPSIIAPEHDDQRIRIIVPPARSTSLQPSRGASLQIDDTSQMLSPQSDMTTTPNTGSTFGRLPSPQLPPLPQRESLLSIVGDSRPESWMSADSSMSSLPSPLLPQELYDAFPSVPEGTPLPPPIRDPRSAAKPSFDFDLLSSATIPRSASVADVHSPLPPTSAMTPSFDQGLLSSAIHLSSRQTVTPGSGGESSYPMRFAGSSRDSRR